MAHFLTILLPLLGASLIHAVPNVTATVRGLGRGTYGCYSLPNSESSLGPGWTGYDFTHQPFYLTPANSSIDGLHSTFGSFQGKNRTNSSNNMVLSTNSSLVHRLSCEGGNNGPALPIYDEDMQNAENNTQYIFFTEEGGLAHANTGLLIQIYGLEFNCIKLDGVYVGEQASGATGVSTTWTFEYHQGAEGSVDWYEVKLLKQGESPQDGEIDGFLKVVGL
jgi:hypothetical protein